MEIHKPKYVKIIKRSLGNFDDNYFNLLGCKQRYRLPIANLKYGSVFHKLSMQEVHHGKTQKYGKRDFKIG